VIRAEQSHWLFATGFLLIGLCLLAEAIVGQDVWRRRRWRAYLLPALMFAGGLALVPVTVFFTRSVLHLITHAVWAHVLVLAGAAHLGLVSGKLRASAWELTIPLTLVVGGVTTLIHEQNGWLYSRSAFVHHAVGWTLLIGSLFPLARFVRPRSPALAFGYALTVVALAVILYTNRGWAPALGGVWEQAGPAR
jgi:hypothetical protein